MNIRSQNVTCIVKCNVLNRPEAESEELAAYELIRGVSDSYYVSTEADREEPELYMEPHNWRAGTEISDQRSVFANREVAELYMEPCTNRVHEEIRPGHGYQP